MPYLWLIAILFSSTCVWAETCIDVTGDAAIVSHDTASAKLEAVARAKWMAIEQTSGTQIQASSLVQDFALVDENIITKTKGVIRSYHIVKEQHDQHIYHVLVHVCVSPEGAKTAMDKLIPNTSVGLLILARSKKEKKTPHAQYKIETLHVDQDPFSSKIKQELLKHDVQIIDVASLTQANTTTMTDMVSGDATKLRKAMLESMANVFIIGEIHNVISTEKGADIGYGIAMPMYKVTSQLNYKILSKEANGTIRTIQSNTDESIGMALSLAQANQRSMKQLDAKSVAQHIIGLIDGKAQVIDLKIDGLPGLNAHEEIKDRLHQIQWVMFIQDIGLGHFQIKYKEKTLYLANSLQRIKNLNVTNFSNTSIQTRYQKPQ